MRSTFKLCAAFAAGTVWRVLPMCLVVVGLLGCASCAGKSHEEMKRDTRDSITRQLIVGKKIRFEELARQAYADGGWSDDGILQQWLRPIVEGERILRIYRPYASEMIWIWETQAPEEELVAVHSIVLWMPVGPQMGWKFFLDADGYVRCYRSSGGLRD